MALPAGLPDTAKLLNGTGREPGRGDDDGAAAGAAAAPRDILIILHGKRVGDTMFEEGVRELKEEGHKVGWSHTPAHTHRGVVARKRTRYATAT